MISFRKIGGLWWLRIGSLRIAFCKVKTKRPSVAKLPHIRETPDVYLGRFQ